MKNITNSTIVNSVLMICATIAFIFQPSHMEEIGIFTGIIFLVYNAFMIFTKIIEL